jgi:hypothetical protein
MSLSEAGQAIGVVVAPFLQLRKEAHEGYNFRRVFVNRHLRRPPAVTIELTHMGRKALTFSF